MPKKLVLDCTDELWNKLLKYKIDKDCKNNNEAVVRILEKELSK